MSIAAKIKTEQVVEDISQELNSVPKDDGKDIKKEASEVKKERSEKKKEAKGSHPCPECNKVFTQSSNLKTHMDLHKGIRPFKCSKCEKTFAQKGNWKTHEAKCLDSTTTSKSESNNIKSEVISKNDVEHLSNATEEESPPEEDILKAIDNLEKPVKPKIEPPSEDDIIGAIENLENDVKSKPKENEDVLKAIEQLQQSDIKPEITQKFTCKQCSYPAKTKYELDKHVKTKHEGPSYSCTFCDFNTSRKENLSLHLKNKHDKFLNLAKEVKKLTENVVPINLPQNLKLTPVSSTSAANPSAVSIKKASSSAKVASITKFAASVKKVASISKSSSNAKNATITKSTPKVATISKVDHSKNTGKLAEKDEVREIVSITPVSKPSKSDVKEIVSITPVAKSVKVPASTASQKTSKAQISTAPQKTGTPKLSQKEPPVKNLIGANNKQNTPVASVVKKIIKSEGNIWKSNKQSDLKNNVFKSDIGADKSNNLKLFEYDVRPKEETMLNLLTKAPIAKFTPDESCSLPPSPFLPLGTPSVFGTKTVSPIEGEEDKKPQQVDQNPREELAMEATSKIVEDEEEEDFECKDCLTIFWFKSELHNHLRDAHGVKEPELKAKKDAELKAKNTAESILGQPKGNAIKTSATPNIERKMPQNEEKPKAVKPAIKDKDKSSNLPNKRKAEHEAANQKKGKSLKSDAPKIGTTSSTLKWPESSNMTPKVAQTKAEKQNVKVAITPVQKESTTKSHNQNKAAMNSNSKVAITRAENPNPKSASHGYSGVSITPVVTKLSSTASKQHSAPVVTKLTNNKTKQPSAPVVTKLSKQQTPVPTVTKLTNKTVPKQTPVPTVTKTAPKPLSAAIVTKLPNKTEKKPPLPVVTKVPSKTTNQISQNKLEVQSAKVQNLKNKLKTRVSEGTTKASIKITPVPQKRSLPSSSEEPKNKVAKLNAANVGVKDDDDDADYSCKVKDCMESFWYPGQLKEHMTKIHKT